MKASDTVLTDEQLEENIRKDYKEFTIKEQSDEIQDILIWTREAQAEISFKAGMEAQLAKPDRLMDKDKLRDEDKLANQLEEPRVVRLLAEWIAIDHDETRLEYDMYMEEAQELYDYIKVVVVPKALIDPERKQVIKEIEAHPNKYFVSNDQGNIATTKEFQALKEE